MMASFALTWPATDDAPAPMTGPMPGIVDVAPALLTVPNCVFRDEVTGFTNVVFVEVLPTRVCDADDPPLFA